MSLHDSPAKDEFVELITRHRNALFGYILALVQNTADAEDLLQQTCLVLWRKFDQYDPEGNFVGWASKTAQFEVLNFFKRRRRDRVVLSDELLGDLATALVEADDEDAARKEALAGCLAKLSTNDRALVEQCYEGRANFKTVAEKLGRSADGVYKSLARIRQWLFECVERVLSQGERPQ